MDLLEPLWSGLHARPGANIFAIVADNSQGLQIKDRGETRSRGEVLRELLRLRDEGVTEVERRRAITAAEAQHEFANETAEGRAQALGRAETIWRLEDELAYLDRLRAVTRAQIQAVARKYLDPDRYVRVTFLPAQ